MPHRRTALPADTEEKAARVELTVVDQNDAAAAQDLEPGDTFHT
jgi:hypothetical protein